MACFWKHVNETSIKIPEVCEVEGITFYKIHIEIHAVKWTVTHRYKEFYQLHQILCNDHGVARHILPPKKTIRNKCPDFIETRRYALEVYLQNIFHYLKRTMPLVFTDFLDFHVYDTFYLVKNLAFDFYTIGHNGDQTKSYFLNPLELHAIHVCFKEPFPNIVELDTRFDLSNVLDFCSQVTYLKINGISKEYLTSNIIPNDLTLDFSVFKNLQILEIEGMLLENVSNLGNLRSTLNKLAVHKTTTTISQILQCDVLHKTKIDFTYVWSGIMELDLTENEILEIDESINLVPNVKILNLSCNKISKIADLSKLTHLTNLYVANNLLTKCDTLHLKLCHVLTLDLSQNAIASLEGFGKLYSLENLNISSNNITDITELRHIGALPCLENLILTGNVVATVVDYRSKVFEYFGERAKDICLDNEKPTQAELDKAALFHALTIIREGKTPLL